MSSVSAYNLNPRAPRHAISPNFQLTLRPSNNFLPIWVSLRAAGSILGRGQRRILHGK